MISTYEYKEMGASMRRSGQSIEVSLILIGLWYWSADKLTIYSMLYDELYEAEGRKRCKSRGLWETPNFSHPSPKYSKYPSI